MDRKKQNINSLGLIIIVALLADGMIWYHVFSGAPIIESQFHFLDVGQGDSELFLAPPRLAVLTDAGPDQRVVQSLDRVMPARRKYIDIALITHPQLDHFNGLYYILDHYRVGAVIVNGRDDGKVREWDALIKKIHEKNIPLITLGAGDRIRYGSTTIDILSPNQDFIQSAELNDTALVEYVRTPGFTALLTGDIGANIEEYLVTHENVKSDILKIAHHGSKYSSSDVFLRAVNPLVAGIGVGAKNTYGHPTPETLARLASDTVARVFRTDKNGTVSVFATGDMLKVFTEK